MTGRFRAVVRFRTGEQYLTVAKPHGELRWRLRLDRHLQYAFRSFAEDAVAFDDLIERKPVGEERRGIKAAGLDHRHQAPHSLLTNVVYAVKDSGSHLPLSENRSIVVPIPVIARRTVRLNFRVTNLTTEIGGPYH